VTEDMKKEQCKKKTHTKKKRRAYRQPHKSKSG